MNYRISGIVVRGQGYGRKIGFPTVNLDMHGAELPHPGIYAGTAVLGGREYRAGIIIGPGEKAEAHLMGFHGDVYGREVTLEVKKFLREFREFETEEALIIQIKKDLALC